MMTWIFLGGALAGFGVWLIVRRLPAFDATAASELARLDVQRRQGAASRSAAVKDEETVRDRVGTRVSAWMTARGIELPLTVRSDLAVMDRTPENHLGITVFSAIAGMFVPLLPLIPLAFIGVRSLTLPLWLMLLGAAGGVVLAQVQLHTEAQSRRRDFRHVVSAYLDLVSMNLAGGRGVPEALVSASAISEGWGLVRIRETIENARLQGITPWSALGDLGVEMDVEELRDMAAALALVAEDGAKVRESLTARAASMRQRELSDTERQAQERSQSMLIAQLLLATGFLVFLIYPALAGVVGI